MSTPIDELELLAEYLSPAELAELDALLHNPAAERERFRLNPEAFVREVIGAEPAVYQVRILNAILAHRRVCVRSLHGVGKTTTAAWIVLWFVSTHDECKVPTTASAWRQLKEFLWPEIHKWAIKANWEKIGVRVRLGRELLAQKLEISPTAFAFALNSTDEAKIEGAHSERILYLFDEAKTIPAEIWDAAEGALSTEGSYAVALSTPGDSVGRFYDIQMRKQGYEDWHTIHITLEEAIAAGRVTREWANQRERAWGKTSALYLRRVRGEFAEDEAESVITLGMVERAQERWRALKAREQELVSTGHSAAEAFRLVWGELTHLGCDPARFGRDRTGYGLRYQAGIHEVQRTERQDTMQTAGRVVQLTRATNAIVRIDTIGLGAGVYDRLRELWMLKEWRGNERVCPTEPINVGTKTKATDKTGQFRFRTSRDWMYWNMRELLEADDAVLPPDDELAQDLVTANYRLTSDGVIIVESKDEMRERLPEKRSPDAGEAVMLAHFPEGTPFSPLVAIL